MFPFNTYWMAKETRRQLVTTIIQLRRGGKEAHKHFLDVLQQSYLLLPIAKLPTDYEMGDLFNKRPLPIQKSLVKNSNGKPYLTLYTSEAKLRETHPSPSPYLMVPFHLLAQTILNLKLAGVIIDRNTRTWIVLPASLLRRCLSTKTAKPPISSHNAASRVPLNLGPPPRVIAQNEIMALHHYFEGQKGLINAYLFGLVKNEKRTVLTVGLKYVRRPSKEELRKIKQEVCHILGESGILLLNQQGEANLDRQPGVIRFEMEEV